MLALSYVTVSAIFVMFVFLICNSTALTQNTVDVWQWFGSSTRQLWVETPKFGSIGCRQQQSGRAARKHISAFQVTVALHSQQ